MSQTGEWFQPDSAWLHRAIWISNIPPTSIHAGISCRSQKWRRAIRPLKYALHISQRKTYRLWFWVACSIPPMSVVKMKIYVLKRQWRMLVNDYFTTYSTLLASLTFTHKRPNLSNDYIKFHLDDKVFISKSFTCDMTHHWTKENVILKLVWYFIFIPQYF